MGFSVNVSVPVATVFLQGLLSFFSPCVLPLLPIYIGYLSGGTAEKKENGELYYNRVKVLINTVFFVLGISFAFFVLGLGMTTVGRFFGSNQYLFARMGGVIIILFGLYQLGLFGDSSFMDKERRLPLHLEKLKMSPITALIMGFVFSFAWTPCVGPTLSSVLLMAASASSSAMGFVLVGVYTAGFVIPFLLTGIFTTSLLNLFDKHKNIVKYTAKVGAALMIFMGFLMMTGKLNSITGYLSNVGQGFLAESSVNETVDESASVSESSSSSDDSLSSETSASVETVNDAQAEYDSSDTQDTSADESSKDDAVYAPDFTLVDQYGNTHTLSDYRGKLVFLNFWATWCPPCRAEMPDIQALYEETESNEDSDIVVLGVAFPNFGDETDSAKIAQFLKDNGYTYPVVMDDFHKLVTDYYITAYPTTFMISPDGVVLGYIPGGMTKDVMDNVIDEARKMSGMK